MILTKLKSRLIAIIICMAETVYYVASNRGYRLVALKACPRVHPFLSKLAQLYFFADITLHDKKYVDDADENDFRSFELSANLSSCPEIAHHVHNLKICVVHLCLTEHWSWRRFRPL